MVLVVFFFIFPLLAFSLGGGPTGMGTVGSISSTDDNLEKTNYEQEIALINHDMWNSTVSSSYLPDYYFGDYSILPGYSGEFTLRSWSFDILNASEMFKYFIIPRESLLVLSSNFNESYITKAQNSSYRQNQTD